MRGNYQDILDSVGATPMEAHFRRTSATFGAVAQPVRAVKERMRDEIK
jgi:hypothetical protein